MRAHNRLVSPKISFFLIFLVVVVGSFGCANDEIDQHSLQPKEPEHETIVRMDVTEMREHRDNRRTKFVESVAQSKLSKDHRDLVAKALAKLYVGVPVSSYSETFRNLSASVELTDGTENWRITDEGYLQNEASSSKIDLRLTLLFIPFPTPSFVAETARLFEESNTVAKFVFELENSEHTETLYESIFMLDSNSDWIMEFFAVKKDQSPKSIVLEIKAPTYENPAPRLEAQSYEFDYSFVASCGCFAVSRSKTLIEGSVIFVGRILPRPIQPSTTSYVSNH